MFTVPFFSNAYLAVLQDEDREAFLPKSEKPGIDASPPTRTKSSIATVLLLSLFTVVTTTLAFYIGQRNPISLDTVCTKYTSKYCKS